MACWLLRVSHLVRGKHAVTGCDGKCLVGCTTNPPLGPISMQWEGVMGNGHALYFNINSLPSSPQCWERVENPSVLVPFCHGSPSNATHLPTGRNIDGDQGFHMTCTLYRTLPIQNKSFDILSTSMFECLCICATRLVIFQRRTVGSPPVAFWPDPVFWPTLIDSLLAAAGANQSWKGERGVFSKSWLHFAKLERCCLRGQQI